MTKQLTIARERNPRIAGMPINSNSRATPVRREPVEPTRQQIAVVCKEIDAAEHAYRIGKPILSDAQFDKRMKWLLKWDPNNSRHQRIGAAKTTGRRAKGALPIMVGSLDKLRPAAVGDWMKRLSAQFKQTTWLVLPKFDGQSILLSYSSGSMTSAWSRGRDGLNGVIVTASARYIQGVRSALKPVKGIPAKAELLVRGEVVMHRSIFREFYEGKESAIAKTYKTPRNIVTGLTNTLDPERVKTDLARCTFIALQLFMKDRTGKWIRPYSAHREWVYLQMLGFTTAVDPVRYSAGHNKIAQLVRKGHEGLRRVLPVHEAGGTLGNLIYWEKAPTEAEVKERLIAIQKAIDVKIDGIVVQPVENRYWQDRGDHLLARPTFVQAIKLEAHEQETMDTKVGEIEWNVAKNGLLAPRLILADSVDADGVEVNHATCNNARFVRDWGLRKGRPIRVVRSGDVIPRIVGIFDNGKWVRVDVKLPGIKDAKIDAALPHHCPSCSQKLSWNKNAVHLMCTNEACPGRHGKSVLAFFRHLGVEDVASGVISRLIMEGLNTVPKILEGATVARLSKMDGYQDRKAQIVSRAISGALKDKPLPMVMHASGCFQNDTFSLGGSRLADVLAVIGPGMLDRATPTALRAKLSTLKGFGTAGMELFLDSLEDWRKFYASIRKWHTTTQIGTSLKDTVACFTGFRDPALEAQIIKAGGRVSGMSRKTTVLFAASLGSTKCKKADQYNIPVISQAEAKDWILRRCKV